MFIPDPAIIHVPLIFGSVGEVALPTPLTIISDKFCVDRHKKSFLDLVNNRLDITFANEQEIISLIDAKNFDEVISFSKQLGKLIIITRGEKGSIAIKKNELVQT